MDFFLGSAVALEYSFWVEDGVNEGICFLEFTVFDAEVDFAVDRVELVVVGTQK